jgi:hypothetical protein
MPHFCIFPCERFFATEHGLQVHRARSSGCQERWNDQLGLNSLIPAVLIDGHMNANNAHAEGIYENNAPDDITMDEQGDFADPNNAASSEMELDVQPPLPVENHPGLRDGDDGIARVEAEAETGASESGTDSESSGPIEEEIDHTAARVLRSRTSAFAHFYDAQVTSRKGNLYYPFAGAVEWQFARWAHNSGLSRSRIDELLNLDYASVIS